MREITGDIWEAARGHIICIPTNGVTDDNGHNVMGAGLALACRERFPDIPKRIGDMLRVLGNRPYFVGIFDSYKIVSFPTKDHWRSPSRLGLIGASALDLLSMVSRVPYRVSIYLPRVGCGLGGLAWSDVRKVISPILDYDRFIVVSQEGA